MHAKFRDPWAVVGSWARYVSTSSLTCKHIAVKFLQFEGIIVEFLYHFSGLISNAVLRPHFPENQEKIKVFLFIPRTKYTADAFNVMRTEKSKRKLSCAGTTPPLARFSLSYFFAFSRTMKTLLIKCIITLDQNMRNLALLLHTNLTASKQDDSLIVSLYERCSKNCKTILEGLSWI